MLLSAPVQRSARTNSPVPSASIQTAAMADLSPVDLRSPYRPMDQGPEVDKFPIDLDAAIDLDDLALASPVPDLVMVINRSPQDQIKEIFQGIDSEYVEKLYQQHLQNFVFGDELVQFMIDSIIQHPEYPRAKRQRGSGHGTSTTRAVKRRKVSHKAQTVSIRAGATGKSNDPITIDSDDDSTKTIKLECKCCYSDFDAAEMTSCGRDDSHLFCADCVKSYVSSLLEQSKCRAVCMASADCDGHLIMSQLAEVLDDAAISRLERLQQDEDLRLADIEGLEECPFCDFKAILPPIEEDREMRCLNPACSETSCRLCQQRSHVPKTCQEVIADHKDRARHQVEEAMTEALVRKCNKCKQPFLKADGCNKMTCPKCGNKQCYVCRQTIHGYDHFSPGKCPQADDTLRRHEEEVRKAATETKAKVLKANGEVKLMEEDVDVKFSKQIEEEAKRQRNNGVPYPFNVPEYMNVVRDARVAIHDIFAGDGERVGRHLHQMQLELARAQRLMTAEDAQVDRQTLELLRTQLAQAPQPIPRAHAIPVWRAPPVALGQAAGNQQPQPGPTEPPQRYANHLKAKAKAQHKRIDRYARLFQPLPDDVARQLEPAPALQGLHQPYHPAVGVMEMNPRRNAADLTVLPPDTTMPTKVRARAAGKRPQATTQLDQPYGETPRLSLRSPRKVEPPTNAGPSALPYITPVDGTFFERRFEFANYQEATAFMPDPFEQTDPDRNLTGQNFVHSNTPAGAYAEDFDASNGRRPAFGLEFLEEEDKYLAWPYTNEGDDGDWLGERLVGWG